MDGGNTNSNLNMQESHSSYGKSSQPQPGSKSGNDTKRRLEQILINHQNLKQRLDSENFDTEHDEANADLNDYLKNESTDIIDHSSISIFQKNRSRTRLQQNVSVSNSINFGQKYTSEEGIRIA